MYLKSSITAALSFVLFVLFSFPQPSLSAPVTMAARSGSDVAASTALGGTSIVLTYKDQWSGLSEEDEVASNPPKVLRFPAGTHAMYFDWETGKYKGVKINAKRALAKHGLDKFFSLARRYNAEVSYIVNLYQDTPEKTGRLARHLKSKGYKVRYWELGNELYAPIYEHKFPDAGTYLAVARAHADEILKVFPDAQLGVVADPRTRHMSRWNAALNGQTFFRNIIIHKYIGPEKDKREALAARGAQPNAAAAYSILLRDSEPDDEPNFVDRFDGKRFWVTEYGLLYIGFDNQNSMAHAIWMARTFMKNARTGRVDMMAYWNLNARPFELMEPSDNGFVHRVPFYVYTMILKALPKASVTSPAVFTGNGAQDFSGQYFRTRDTVSIMTVNSGPDSRTLEVPETGSKMRVEYISAESIEASNGYSQAFTPELRQRKTETVKPVTLVKEGKSVVIPGYSVALISFDAR